MYTLVNKYGNAQVKTESAVKRDDLMALGYREVEPPEEEETTLPPEEEETTLPPEGEQEPSAPPVTEELPKAPKNKRKTAAAAANAEEE